MTTLGCQCPVCGTPITVSLDFAAPVDTGTVSTTSGAAVPAGIDPTPVPTVPFTMPVPAPGAINTMDALKPQPSGDDAAAAAASQSSSH